jgi:hypothetical protein
MTQDKFSVKPAMEGTPVWGNEDADWGDTDQIDYDYVERRIPRELVDDIHAMIDLFLRSHKYDPETL